MRRRSLMTPGIATREVPVNPGPSKQRVRHSLPSTPARRGSMESLGDDTSYFPPLTIDPNLIPRALTPCEAEYKQTGAFKLGTLRITNGSPARSPARNPDENKKFGGSEGLLDDEPKENDLESKKHAPNNSISSNIPDAASEQADPQNNVGSLTSSQKFVKDAAVSSSFVEPHTSQFSPEPQPSPLSNDEQLNVPQIQVTSKHTAIEDELFDDEQNEYSSVEVLDVRIDTNAKSSPRAKVTPEKRGSREIIRADSGIASPTSEYSHVPLSKADSGYSSSISLRSLSSKPSALEKDRASEKELEVVNNINTNKDESTAESKVASRTAVLVVDVTRPVEEAPPPPVPMKDPPSKETLGTILSVGSAELLQDDDVSPKSSGGQLWTSDRIQRKPVSSRSPITHSTSVSTKKPIPRKPVPIRINDSGMTGEFTRTPEAIDENSGENELAQAASNHVTSGDVSSDGSGTHVTGEKTARHSLAASRRTGSGTSVNHTKEDLEMNNTGAEIIYGQARDRSHSLTSPELPLAMSNIKSSKSPPPTSVNTSRNEMARTAFVYPSGKPRRLKYPTGMSKQIMDLHSPDHHRLTKAAEVHSAVSLVNKAQQPQIQISPSSKNIHILTYPRYIADPAMMNITSRLKIAAFKIMDPIRRCHAMGGLLFLIRGVVGRCQCHSNGTRNSNKNSINLFAILHTPLDIINGIGV
ncbi:hypothetical protein ABKA04_007352 [Annulohypoxylon sp. FPYF3050]